MYERAAADSLDRFVLREVVGSGAMGLVHRAIDRRTGDTVALKKVLADRPELHARFAIEREALASLDHPGIVRLVAHGEAFDGQPFLAMGGSKEKTSRRGSSEAACRRARPRASAPGRRARSRPRMSAASCTATSSPRTCSWSTAAPTA